MCTKESEREENNCFFIQLLKYFQTAFAEVGGYDALLDKYAASEAAPEYTAYEWDPVTMTNK